MTFVGQPESRFPGLGGGDNRSWEKTEHSRRVRSRPGQALVFTRDRRRRTEPASTTRWRGLSRRDPRYKTRQGYRVERKGGWTATVCPSDPGREKS